MQEERVEEGTHGRDTRKVSQSDIHSSVSRDLSSTLALGFIFLPSLKASRVITKPASSKKQKMKLSSHRKLHI